VHPAPPPAIVTPAGAPWIAAPRPGMNADDWQARHRAFVARAARGGIDVLFLGDSITELFPAEGKNAWDRAIAPLGTVEDFGISGDRTEWLLWRVRNGELDRTNARAVVLMIGTNDLPTATPAGIARGVSAIVATVRAKLPRAVVVLNAILPRGEPDDPLRAKATGVNARIAALAGGKHVRWLDAGPGFVDAAGRIKPGLMPDGLHPSGHGYEVWATALRPVLRDALSK
jgi:lysophospholipase L1-like esterase